METAFDHIVIGAESLAQGAAWARETFGAEPPLGGAHPDFGTHNRLARLPAGYLEILAIDPAAPAPSRPRWYGLDEARTQAVVAERPRPIAWVLNTPDLAAAAAAAAWDVGEIRDGARGDLRWRLTTGVAGEVVDGVLPTLIEWPAALGHQPPTGRMPALGLALRGLRLKHPEPSRISSLLESVGAAEAMARAGVALRVLEAAAPGLEAVFTPPAVRLSV